MANDQSDQLNCTKLGFIYLIHLREFINQNLPVYKIGRTYQLNGKRFNSYPKDSIVLLHLKCNDSIRQEKALINIFKDQFIHRKDIGNEYFEGNPAFMIDLIFNLLKNQDNPHLPPPQAGQANTQEPLPIKVKPIIIPISPKVDQPDVINPDHIYSQFIQDHLIQDDSSVFPLKLDQLYHVFKYWRSYNHPSMHVKPFTRKRFKTVLEQSFNALYPTGGWTKWRFKLPVEMSIFNDPFVLFIRDHLNNSDPNGVLKLDQAFKAFKSLYPEFPVKRKDFKLHLELKLNQHYSSLVKIGWLKWSLKVLTPLQWMLLYTVEGTDKIKVYRSTCISRFNSETGQSISKNDWVKEVPFEYGHSFFYTFYKNRKWKNLS